MLQESFLVLAILLLFSLSRGSFRKLHGNGNEHKNEIHLGWFAPFFSGGGYSSEAITFALSLGNMIPFSIAQHGDSFSMSFYDGLPEETRQTLRKMYFFQNPEESIVVCHSEPGAWALPKPLYSTETCPPLLSLYRIGRTMFETDRLTQGHVERCNKMDEIWVPTQFHYKTFTESGVLPEKVRVVPESVDVEFFDPKKHEALDLQSLSTTQSSPFPSNFKFLSIFKWEKRKGWDLLLKAYFSEFSKEDKVSLFLKTNPYHSELPFEVEIQSLIKELGMKEENLPHFVVLDEHIPTTLLPSLYKSVDAFVLPSRGEGWGRPHVEAMAMELPVIATNWSGPTEFLNEMNGYPLPISGLEQIPSGPFRGHYWANPSVEELRKLMRHVMENKEESKEKGKLARKTMVQKYSPDIVAQVIVNRFNEIKYEIESGSLPFVHERAKDEKNFLLEVKKKIKN